MSKLTEEINSLRLKLERAGYHGALDLIRDELVPIAEEKKITLHKAAWCYANPDAEQDTSQYQLWLALLVTERTENTLCDGNYD